MTGPTPDKAMRVCDDPEPNGGGFCVLPAGHAGQHSPVIERCRGCGTVITKRGYSWFDASGRTAHVNGRAGECEWEPHMATRKADAL